MEYNPKFVEQLAKLLEEQTKNAMRMLTRDIRESMCGGGPIMTNEKLIDLVLEIKNNKGI